MAAGLFIAYVKATHPFGYDPRGGAPTGQQRMQHLLCVHVFERDEADPPYITNEENAHMFGLHFIAGGTEAAFYAKVPQGLPVSPKSLRLRPPSGVEWHYERCNPKGCPLMTVNSTIGTGQDYGTPQLWEAAIPNNPTEDYVGTCMVDEEYSGATLQFDPLNSNGVDFTLDVDSSVRHNFDYSGARITWNSASFQTVKVIVNGGTVTFKNLAIEASVGGGQCVAQNGTPVLASGGSALRGGFFSSFGSFGKMG